MSNFILPSHSSVSTGVNTPYQDVLDQNDDELLLIWPSFMSVSNVMPMRRIEPTHTFLTSSGVNGVLSGWAPDVQTTYFWPGIQSAVSRERSVLSNFDVTDQQRTTDSNQRDSIGLPNLDVPENLMPKFVIEQSETGSLLLN